MKYERDKEYALKVIDSYLYGTLSCVGNTKVVPENLPPYIDLPLWKEILK